MDSTYHEAFWVAIAAANPVITVGYVICLERLLRYNRRRFPGERKNDPRHVRSISRRSPIFLTTLVGAILVGFGIPVFSTAIALVALANGNDAFEGSLQVLAFTTPFTLGTLSIACLAAQLSMPKEGAEPTNTANPA